MKAVGAQGEDDGVDFVRADLGGRKRAGGRLLRLFDECQLRVPNLELRLIGAENRDDLRQGQAPVFSNIITTFPCCA